MQDTEGSRGSKEIKDKVHRVANFATFPQNKVAQDWIKTCTGWNYVVGQ